MRFAIVAAGALAASAVVLSGGTARADGSMDDKKITVGGDLQFIIPVGDFSNGSGPQIGPLVHFGYRVIPPLEITARTGYLFGLSKSQTVLGQTISTSVSNFPIWVGARYYLGVPSDAPAGLYAAAELALNVMNVSVSGNNVPSASSGETREGFNLGAGYVISQDLPIDIRAQFTYLNLLGTNSGESALFGIGISAGYSFFF